MSIQRLKRTSKVLTILSATFVPFSVYANDTTPTLGFYGSGEAGLNDSTGNTTSTTLYGALKLNYNETNHELKSVFEVNYKSDNNVQSQERYLMDVQSNRFYSQDRSYYSFIGGQLEKSRFEGIELDTTLAIGLGKNLFKNDRTQLTGEAGIGYQSTTYTDEVGDKSTDQTVGRFKLVLDHQINATVDFYQDAIYKTSSERNQIETNTGLKVKVAERLNFKAAYKYRHNDNPASNIKKTDTQTVLTLIYDF